ncbi:MAG: hypothetical protein WAV20_04095 [Blastocatellia bacterium]
MKRVLFSLLALSLGLISVACPRTPSPNQSMAPQAAAVNKQARITVTYVPATTTTPAKLTIDAPEDGIKISKQNQDTIKWKVKYDGPNSSNPALITLDEFTNVDDSSDKNPFGNGSANQNQFKFEPTSNGGEKTEDTQPANKKGSFRFTITVTLPDNGPIIKVDPVVVIDN